MKFQIKDKRVILIDRTMRLVGDNEYEFEFEFDEEWTGKIKTARFILGDYKLDIVLDNDRCTLDKTFFKDGQLIVGVYSSNVATEVLKHKVKPSILEEDGSEPTVPEDLWTQLLEIIDADVQSVRQATSDAQDIVDGFGDVVKSKQEEFNTHAAEKQIEFNQNAADKIREYDEHVIEYKNEINSLKDDLVNALSDTYVNTENLSFSYVRSYPDATTFAVTKQDKAFGYWIFEQIESTGGVLSVSWDTSQLTQFDILLYLFKDGEPYQYIQKNFGLITQPQLAGDNVELNWKPAGTAGSGFCKSTAPFTVQIPDGCTIMVCMRQSGAVYPGGVTLSPELYLQASTFFTVQANEEKEGLGAKLKSKVDVSQGVENANRTIVTDENGNIVVGQLNPSSMALRPSWDTVIHRGWISGAFENTIPAFYLAKENGYNVVECDIRCSSDGIPVLAHDTTITSEDGSTTLTVADSTVVQLQSITLQTHSRFGEIRMNTFADILDMARCLGMKLVLDIKVGGEVFMKSVANLVLRYGMSKNVIYMPIGVQNAQYIASVDKNASFDFVSSSTKPTAGTDFEPYKALLTGANTVCFDVQANTWGFVESDINAINNAGLGLCAWNVLSTNYDKCIDSGMLRITKHNNFDDMDFDSMYFANKSFW